MASGVGLLVGSVKIRLAWPNPLTGGVALSIFKCDLYMNFSWIKLLRAVFVNRDFDYSSDVLTMLYVALLVPAENGEFQCHDFESVAATGYENKRILPLPLQLAIQINYKQAETVYVQHPWPTRLKRKWNLQITVAAVKALIWQWIERSADQMSSDSRL